MSLLLDARKKLQQTSASGSGAGASGLSLEPLANQTAAAAADEDSARRAGKNLFSAKQPSSFSLRPPVNRNVLYALGVAVVLLAGGAGYVWYVVSGSDTPQPMPVRHIAPATPASSQARIVANNPPQLAGATQSKPSVENPPEVRASTKRVEPKVKRVVHASPHGSIPDIAAAHPAKPVYLQPQSEPSLDPALNRAYQAYRAGKLDEARQLYLDVLAKDPQNSDALQGLGVIAQQRGEDTIAAQYYARVLNLDPRNAVANAGMSALHASGNHESRLKTLLREQGDSAALHFALGNLYAEQSRWSEAQQAYFNAYTLDAKNAHLAYNLAVSLDHLGQGKLAADYYQRALQLDTSNSAGFNHAQVSQHAEELLQ